MVRKDGEERKLTGEGIPTRPALLVGGELAPVVGNGE
jgi:hypothetical protein